MDSQKSNRVLSLYPVGSYWVSGGGLASELLAFITLHEKDEPCCSSHMFMPCCSWRAVQFETRFGRAQETDLSGTFCL